jgi:hypothetical protein
MPKIIILRSFKRYREDELNIKTSVIIQRLTENPHFPSPQPSLEEINQSRIAFVDALVASKTGDKQATLRKKECRSLLEKHLELLALYVNMNCSDNEEIAKSSGFNIKKKGKPVGILAKPSNLRVVNGPAKGTLIANIDRINRAKSYIYQITTAPVTETSIWETHIISRKKMVFENLASGKEYAIKVAAVGKEPILVYSDVVFSYVL